jgi:hypothetical protein
LTSVADANVAGPMPGYPDNNGLLNRNGGTIGTISSGAYDVYGGGRGLVRFAIPPQYTAANITRAVLRLTVKNWEIRNVHAPYRLDLHRLLKSWKEGAGTETNQVNSAQVDGITGRERFWGAQDGSEDWSEQLVGLKDNDAASAASATLSKPSGSMEAWSFDVTALAKAWAADSAGNFGVILVTGIPADNDAVFDFPIFYAKEAAVADSLKPTLILNGP